jgi:hypothetical protein
MFMMIALMGCSWLAARWHRNRQLHSQLPKERAVPPKEAPTAWELDVLNTQQRRQRTELLELVGNPPHANVIQVKRALGECWLTCEENGNEIARSEVVRLPLDTPLTASMTDECTEDGTTVVKGARAENEKRKRMKATEKNDWSVLVVSAQ